jgi:hypothetical protein
LSGVPSKNFDLAWIAVPLMEENSHLKPSLSFYWIICYKNIRIIFRRMTEININLTVNTGKDKLTLRLITGK